MKVFYKKNYTKIILFLIIFIVLFCVCLVAIQNPSKYVYFLLPSPSLVIVLCLLGLITLPYISYHFIGWIFKARYGLEINEKGINNYLYFLKVNFIKWDEIVDVSLSNESNEKRIKIIVKDFDKYLKESDFLTRFFMNHQVKNGEAVIYINPYFLKAEKKELFATILKEWKNNNLRSNITN
jgi:hypothetical protein